MAAASLTGSVGATAPTPTTEVIVTLHAPSLIAFGRSLTSVVHSSYAHRLAVSQAAAVRSLEKAIPTVRVLWRYRIVADGFDIVVPTADLGELPHIAGIAKVWPVVSYHSLAVRFSRVSARVAATQGPQVIGANRLWGANLATAGNGEKIAVIDDGVDAKHVYFDPSGFSYPAGFPKGLTADTSAKVIVQRTFAPAEPIYRYASTPFDPTRGGSFHATHVAGIAAGDNGTSDGPLFLSGVAPKAYLGNYKALTIPTPGFGLDGNSGSLAAAIEAAVRDGMNVINMSLGEPEVAPSRDFVVQALNAAAAAGVVPVIAAGNDFDVYGYGGINSPGTAASAITVAATTTSGAIADFSAAGPTPVSLQLKPDVSAPGVAILSSLPTDQGGPFGELSGTSMATPQVSGAVALLLERHPGWSVAEVKSALVQTATPVRGYRGREVSVLREGGGMVDLVRADRPLLFAAPTSLSFPVNGGSLSVALTDAGGGAGSWSATVAIQQHHHAGVSVHVTPATTLPGSLSVTSTVATDAKNGPVTGFVLLRHGGVLRRIPFLVLVDHPLLRSEPSTLLTHPGTYSGTTVGGQSKVSHYIYPTGNDVLYPGPEVVYRIHLSHPVANFGVAVTAGKAVPHVVFAGDENHLTGFAGQPSILNPYLTTYGETRPVAGAVLATPGNYEIVFDTLSPSDAGEFTFRYWVNDTTPPTVHVVSTRNRTVTLTITDSGSGVDPSSITATIDGRAVRPSYQDGRLTFPAFPGSHLLVVSVSDYQELKNMEDVSAIKPNTTTLRRTILVGG